MDAASLNVRTISDPDGNEIAVREVRALDQEWVYMFMEGSQRSPQLVSLSAVTTPNTTPVMLRGEGVDYVGIVNDASKVVEPIFVEDAIMYDNISPTQLVQYNFSVGTLLLRLHGFTDLSGVAAIHACYSRCYASD
jgi:hypothetical protein